jgi:perosamine synthetase
MVTTSDPAVKERLDSERNQGRSPDMGWLDHDRLGFNYRLSDIACALGIAQLQRLDELLAGRSRVAALYREALEGSRASAPVPRRGRRPPRLVRVRRAAPEGDRPRRHRPRAGERGVQSKPYLPAIHLMSYYRERFGHRAGEFPVCEDVAARSLALPFFPEMTEGQVARVAEALRSALT